MEILFEDKLVVEGRPEKVSLRIVKETDDKGVDELVLYQRYHSSQEEGDAAWKLIKKGYRPFNRLADYETLWYLFNEGIQSMVQVKKEPVKKQEKVKEPVKEPVKVDSNK